MSGSNYVPRAVFCLHGIRTHASWQKTAGELLANSGIRFKLYDFGRYGLHKFIWRGFNDREVDRFYRAYDQIVNDKNFRLDPENIAKRPSVIAHSFGTYIAAYCMQKRPDMRFDKMILCGSILPLDFSWKTLFNRGQVNFVRNEWATADPWARHVSKIVPRTGSSGSDEFDYTGERMVQVCFKDYRHSDYFERSHIQNNWIPFLKKSPFLPPSVHAVQGRSITEPELYTRTLLGLRDVDKLNYPGLPENDKLPWGISQQWIEKERDIYTVLFDQQDHVQGYLNTMPLKSSAFERIKKNGINHKEIAGADLQSFTSGSPLKLYLASIGIAPESRHPASLDSLTDGFFAKLYYYASQQIRVSEFAAIGWSREGCRLCKAMGMEQISQYKDSDGKLHPVFWMSLNAKITSGRKFSGLMKKLVELYKTIS